MSVTNPVTIANPISPENQRVSANWRVDTVARAEAQTFTRLLPMRIVISNLSLSLRIISSDFDHHFFSLLYHSIACRESVIRAISVPEKNADKIIKITNKNIDEVSK